MGTGTHLIRARSSSVFMVAVEAESEAQALFLVRGMTPESLAAAAENKATDHDRVLDAVTTKRYEYHCRVPTEQEVIDYREEKGNCEQ